MGHGRPGHKHEEADTEAGMAHVSPTLARLVENLRRAMDGGLIARADPHLVALGLWTSVHGITSLLIAIPDFPWPADREVLTECVITQALAGASALHGPHGEALHEAVQEEVVDQRDRHGDDHR